MQIGIVSRFWFCGRPWRLKINIRRCLMYFRKPHVCANVLDVQEPDFSFTQFYRSWNHFSRCRFPHGRFCPLSLSGIWWLKYFRPPNRTEGPETEPRCNPSAVVKPNMHNPIPIKHTIVIPTNIDDIPPNTTHSSPSALLYVFEDNEAVIKMLIKRSKSHNEFCFTDPQRVALDWVFDRINLDPKIQIRYIDTKHQLADILTKGNFTRDEWYNLLHLFNISHFSSLCCAQNFSLTSCTKTMAKTMQEQKEEDRIVAKSKPTAMNLTSTVSTSSSSVNHPIASKNPGIVKASTGKPDARARRNSKPDAASSSQGRLKDAYLGGLMVEVQEKPAATDKSQESWELSESVSWSNHEKEVTGKLVASRSSGNSGNSKAGSRKMAT